MIDFHSHILPGLDDGSQTIEESLALLDALKRQGVDIVVATPHFYADQTLVADFLKRRNNAVEKLRAHLPEGMPKIICGAEVLYYPGISKLADMKALCIEGTKRLLLEMPMERWTEYTVRELIDMAGQNRCKLVIAHMDRYMHFQSKKVLTTLREHGILLQVNAGFFLNFSTKKKALRLFKIQEIHMIGSDCHNMTSRPPRIGEAFEVIRKKCGEQSLREFDGYGRFLLNHS